MVIEVIVGDVRENTARKVQARRAVLMHRVAAYFHKCVVATGIRHVAQQSVDCQGIGRGVGAFDHPPSDAVLHGAKQSGFVAKPAEQVVE